MLARKKWHESLTDEVILGAAERQMTTLDNPGFCLSCGLEHEGCEPDARRYVCESCGERQVYGAEELMVSLDVTFMGEKRKSKSSRLWPASRVDEDEID
jgi:hypothetical protein